MTKRLFIAIKINPDQGFLDAFRMLTVQLRHERIKWVEEHNIHITLKFLGITEELQIPRIEEVLSGLASGTRTFSFSLRKLGLFGSAYAPKVIWAGIEPPGDLAGIMKDVHDRLATIGFEADRQNLVPHLTLGRINQLRDKPLFQLIIGQHKNISSGIITVDRIFLFESILKKEGPVYIALQNYPLKGTILP